MTANVTRGEAKRLLRAVLVPIAAIALAADEECERVADRLFPNPDLRVKMLGSLKAAVWTIATKAMLTERPVPGIVVYEPYSWTELVAWERVHVALVRDDARGPKTERKRQRKAQICQVTMPIQYPGEKPERFAVTAVDIAASLDSQRRITAVCVRPAGGGDDMMWPPIPVDLKAARGMLSSWRQREVPWLDDLRILTQVAVAPEQLELQTARANRLAERLDAVLADRHGHSELTAAAPALETGGMSMPDNPNATEADDEAEQSS